MDKSITDNAVEQIAVNPDQTAQVVENSDKFENNAQLLQAVFDPNVVTQKTNKSLDDMTEWQRFIHDPWVAYESNDPRFDRFKPFADLSRDPEWYSLAQKYGKDLVFKTDTILGYTQPARTGLGRFIEGYNYAADSLRLADREAQLSDARTAGNYGLASQIENEIAEIKFRMANDETPLQSKSWSSVADISASSLRNMPEILAINLIAGSLAAPTGGASLVAGRGAVAATIYNDTFNIEFGSLLREIMEKNPGMAEADAREMATKGARVNALIEALPSLIPGLDVTAGIGKRAAQTVLGKVTKKALAQAAKANPTGFRKWLAEAFKILGEYGVEVGSESVQEVLQEISGQSAVRAATEGGDFYKMSEDRLINFITDPFGEQNQDLWEVFGYTSLGAGVMEGVSGLVFGGAGRARRLGRMGNRNRQTLEQQAMGGAMNRTLADQLFQQRQNSEAPSQLQTEANKRMQARGIAPETVRIDKETAQALAIDPEVADAMRELGIQAALAESEDNGGVVEVDFSKYDDVVNTNEALFQKIRDAVSFSPEAVSFAEFQRYIKMLDAKTIGEIERARQDSESVYNRILAIAKQAGVDQQIAESYAVMAQLEANRAGTFRMGKAVSGEEMARRLEIRWAGVEPEITTPAQIETDVVKPAAFRKGGAIRPTDWVDYTVPEYTGGEALPSTYTKAGKLKDNVLKSIKALFTPEELAYEYTTFGETSNLEGLIESTFNNAKNAKASPTDNAVRQMARVHRVTPAQMYNMIMLARGEPTKEFPADNEAYYTDEKIEVDGKERPTLDSNRNPIAYTEQELIDFWRWFGDSKATDGLDRPVAVVKDTSVEGKWGEGIYFKETEDTNTNYGFLKIDALADYDTYSYTDETITDAFNKEGIDGATNYNGVWAVKQENQFREAAPAQTQEERTLHQFVGENANLEKEAPELAKRLNRAKEMADEGKSDEEIFAETHIRRAPDGKLRVQISDKEARMSPKARKWLKRTEKGRLSKVPLSKGMTLGDIFEHDLLFALYPQLKDLPVSVSGEQKTYASRDRDGNSFINLSVKEAPYRIRQMLLHEVQHVIQRYESWARGDPTAESQRSGEAYRERARLLRLISGGLRDNNVLTYWAASKTGEGFLYVGEEEFRAMQDSPAVKELAGKDPEFAKRVERVKELNEQLKSADSRSSEAQYMRLFGEAEARLTEKLSFMSQEELDQIDPYGYFDVSEFIVKDQEGNLITTVAAPENTQTTGEFFIEFDADAAEAIFGKKITAGKFYREGDKLVIELTPNANATTFIHELFHWFAYELEEAFNSGEMTDYWKGKVEDLAKMVGAKIEDGKIYLTDRQEEKAADMFLDYITEGKVQNREVKPLFAYLQNVFKGIYKVANKHLSPEAMELFDSIFRAQDVIEDEHRIVGLIPINKPENADQGLYDMYTGEMLNSRVRATQELHKTWASIEKYQQSKEYEQKRNEVRLEVAQELNQETRYIVVDEYNKQNKNAAATWLALQTNPETQDLDLSLEQIADIVENTPDKTTEIDRITNQRMNELVMKKYNISPEEFGLRESRNTSKVRALLAEAMMREGKTVADFDAEYSQLLEKADKQVAKSSLNRLADKQYWNNLEARIVERYAYALSQGDQKAMAEARRDQAVVNAIRMRAESIVNRAKRFKEQAEKFRGAQPKVSYQLNGEKVYEHKYAAKDYDLLQSILEGFGFSVNYARRKPIPVGQKLDEWIDEQEATTITRAGELRNFIPFINEGFDGEFQYMTGADFEKLESVFNAVKSVSGAKFSIILTNDKILLSSLVASTAKNMNDMGLKPFKKKDSYWARTFGTFGKFTNPEAIIRKLFPQDVLNKVWLPFINAAVLAERKTGEWVDAYRAAKGKVKLDNTAKTYSTGQTLTNKQVADLLLSMGNKHAYDNMRLSLGVYLGGELTEVQAEAIVSEALQDQPALAEFAKEVWAIYGKAAEQLDKEFEERTNTLFVEKDHRAFEINGIKFEGGYVPVRKDLDYLPEDPRAVNQGGMVHDKKFEKLVTKAPDGNMKSIVDITENELSQSAKQGFTAVEYNNARKYLLADGTKAAIGERAFAFLRDWLTAYMMPKYDTSGWVRPFATVTTVGALGFRLSTALLQLSGLGPAAATLGPTYFARGIAMAFRNKEWVPYLATRRGAKKSDYMNVRIGDPRSSLLGQSITDAVRSTDANTKAGKIAKVAFGKAGQAAMGLIQQVDTIVANITWNGAYLKALDAGMTIEEAKREADSVVRTVQSDSLEVSRSIAMQGPMARMVTAFATWIMAMQSMFRAQIATRRYGEAALWAAMYMFISPVFESFLKEATKIGGGDDDKDYLERVLKTCYNEVASTVGSSIVPFAGLGGAGLTAILEGAWEGITDEKGPFDMRQANVPALQAAGRAFSAARYTLAGKMDKAAYYGASTFSMEMGRLVKYLLAE